MSEDLLKQLKDKIEECWRLVHVTIADGTIPGITNPCRCEECRAVAKQMDEAGYLDGVDDRWWDDEN